MKEDRHEQFADWITRYYSSHKYIPDGHDDGELIGKLVRCKDCKHFREPNDAKRTPYCWYFAEDVNPEEDYCSWAERRKGNPSEFDAVPVIRCKDCYAYEHQKGDSFGVCKVWMNNTAEDGYCHQGERDEADRR